MEQRVYGATSLARAELLGLQALGQTLGYFAGAAAYVLRSPQGMARTLAPSHPNPNPHPNPHPSPDSNPNPNPGPNPDPDPP